MQLNEKVAIVTGGASGIGAALAQRFAREGAKVLIADIAAKQGEQVAEQIHSEGGDAVFQQTDVSDDTAVKAAIAAATSHYGKLDIVINNAGIPEPKESVTELEEAMFDKLFAVNVKSVYLFAHHAVPVLRDNGGGVIINTASTAGVKPRPGNAAYAASKSAVIAFTKALAVELAADNIRVNALLPVATMTPLLLDFLGGNAALAEEMAAAIPMGRLGDPKDMAACAVFLASDEASFLTGVSLPVDGGWTAG